jgi:hypothetical protein
MFVGPEIRACAASRGGRRCDEGQIRVLIGAEPGDDRDPDIDGAPEVDADVAEVALSVDVVLELDKFLRRAVLVELNVVE